ncbi:GNAT family N-acetyltransferase [uncultured Imperialibacter sp.]|uniref:GNAT family N-acetyltransferase n=1 Tax=uncultured Imperialibacter sp. TaxID=1672639 RepID=UPI0030DB7E45|tara:strand:- start:161 stop:706 length:546 start_codon:yes stop_codon:yes gene_type:complete
MKKLTLPSGEAVFIRPIQPTDAPALLAYFGSFSDLTRKRFGPHPFDEATVRAICENLDDDPCIRLAAFAGDKCVAYCLLLLGILPDDDIRLKSYGIDTDQFTYATYAPSVDEKYHGTGLANAIFTELEYDAKKAGATHIILWGGVQHGNPRARRFYEKNGFLKVGEFDLNGGDDDMVKPLS